MDKNKQKEITKKLQDLVKNQNTPIVVVKRGSIKKTSGSSSDSSESYSSYSDYN
jgi:hypothetical protein